MKFHTSIGEMPFSTYITLKLCFSLCGIRKLSIIRYFGTTLVCVHACKFVNEHKYMDIKHRSIMKTYIHVYIHFDNDPLFTCICIGSSGKHDVNRYICRISQTSRGAAAIYTSSCPDSWKRGSVPDSNLFWPVKMRCLCNINIVL